ncbi:MAG: DUF3307 domain-containing protein [Endomicrobiales bacterium]|jgi:hypothetical protein
MQIIWLLVLAHLLTDFTFQTNIIAEWKRRSSLGGIVHSGIFFVCAVILCYPSLGIVWVQPFATVALNGWETLIVLSTLHFIEDAWRVWTIQKMHSPDSFFFFLLDQFIHLSFIVALSPKDSGGSVAPWVLGAILFILVTHFSSVFIYFMEKDVFGKSALLSNTKYYFMFERLMVAGALQLPGLTAFGSVLGIWVIHAIIFRLRKQDRFSLFNAIAGNGMALAFGLIARHILH